MAKSAMLKFISTDAHMPEKRSADIRTHDFNEIYGKFEQGKGQEQAARCSQCGVPFCQIGCPLGNNIPDWLMLSASDRMEEAYHISAATNAMPEICGRICPQDRLCEGVCVIEQSGHGAVTIGAVEKYITDTAFESGWVKPIVPARELSTSIGIIGAGPGGLSAASRLREYGHQVVIYDRYDRAGGLLTYGIPGFKLEKDIVMRRIAWLEESGVKFRYHQDIGKNISYADIRAQHDAIIIATGVYKPRAMQVAGTDLDAIYPALDFLTASNRKSFGDQVPAFEDGSLNAKDKRVIVVGGGDTAMDCVRTATRQGAKSVTCLYRRNQENMPGSAREVANAIEEGVDFMWLSAPAEFIGTDKVTSVRVQKMRLGEADATGRRSPQIVEGSDFNMETDMVIMALGFDPENVVTLFDQPQLPVTKWGTIIAQPETGATALDGVYAIGDIVRGASLVVWAVKDGMDCAAAIHHDLQHHDLHAKNIRAA
ncbi:MAG: NAD(P)-dependent oxidoreductase [Alphaproteobacteria bacterium]